MLQNLDNARETFLAILMITTPSGHREVHAFEKELRTITGIQDRDINDEELLDSTPFSCCTNAKGVITSVWRPT